MTRFTFVHAADLHLDAPFRGVSDLLLSARGGRTRASEHLVRLLREGTFLALERLTDLCIRERADFILLSGDVYNSADSSLRARLALRDAFVRLEAHGVRVFMVHGNHDPLSGEASAIPWPGNVTVFGRQLETHPVTRRGETLALIHGVSHTGPRESKNLAGLFKRKTAAPLEADLFQIGLLHCALTDMSGAHAPYAPCSFSDLAAADMDYWALGHVHACRVLDRQGKSLAGYFAGSPAERADGLLSGRGFGQTAGPAAEQKAGRPFAAYPGSLQGLHVNETGPHGCLLLKADGRGGLTAEAVPLAPVQWEALRVDIPQEAEDIPALENFLLEGLAGLSPRRSESDGGKPEHEPEAAGGSPEETGPPSHYPPEAVIVRLALAGRSDLDHELRKNGAAEDLGEHLNAELDSAGLWVRDVIIETRPLADLTASRERPDLAGEALRRAFSLQSDPEALALAAEQSLAPLFQRPKARKLLIMPKDEELAGLAEEAALLCLDLLEGE